ncbi:MAG TPA: nucleotidyl transferase AbiEii/AbiGii toxin family protein [Thermoanaerobaculia bacterium]|nr:nucleotidyl transferase AbiEii/AbiGii toxin family protein [Thermoanaerobaculia bacterium]
MSRLSRLQEDVLHGFFRRTRSFFLTGGAALAAFHLGHRATDALDLFTSSADLDEGVSALRSVAEELGASIQALRTSPAFRRFLIGVGAESVIVDLVRDRAPQIHVEKLDRDGVLVDPPAEILANKLCTLLSRGEVRDLVDVLFLERAGFRAEDAMGPASSKDGGLTPAQLAWVLSQITVGPDARIPAGITPDELRAFLENRVSRLTRLAWPGAPAS